MAVYAVRDMFVAVCLAAVVVPAVTAGTYAVLMSGNPTTTQINPDTAGAYQVNTGVEVLAEEGSTSQVNPDSAPKTVTTPRIPDSKVLEVPYIRQIYNLSCEMASLQMALAYRNIQVDQDTLIGKLGVSQPIQKQPKGNTFIWGDPDEAFVGQVSGRMLGPQNQLRTGTGWGVHNGPVARVAQEYRPGSYAAKAQDIGDLLRELAQGNPVVWWHVRDDVFSKEKLTYETRSGKKVDYFMYHVAVIVGYETDEDGQIFFFVHDPLYGQLRLSSQDIDRQWAKYDYAMTVIK